MSKVNRNAPQRSQASESQWTIFEFDQAFPDDAACLAHLVSQRYPDGIYCPKCEKITHHYRVKSRTCYECQFCGHQEYPMVGTIFEGSATSLRLWYHAMFLISSTRCGISAKQLERELGVTYKCAWRMFNKIRGLMSEDVLAMGPSVEMDETYVGGRPRYGHGLVPRREDGSVRKGRRPASHPRQKVTVIGAVERGGRVRAEVVPDGKVKPAVAGMLTRVLPEAVIYTDEAVHYNRLAKQGWQHKRVHHAAKVYVDGDATTNTIEGFWSLVKRGIGGVYHAVSAKHLQSYLDEYSFRYNRRDSKAEGGIFTELLERAQTQA